mgnify:CR=1 FL=1
MTESNAIQLREDNYGVIDQSDAGSVLSVIERAAVNPAVDADKLEKLLALKERVDARESEKEFTRSFAAMAQALPRVKKNGNIDLGGKGNIPFAKWEDVDAVIRPILKEHGFSLSFRTRMEGAATIMTCILAHIGGHSERSECEVKPDPGPGRNKTQEMGSGRSYAKRYLTLDLLNIVTVGQDDDGRASGFLTAEQADKIYSLLDACELPPERRAKFLKLMNAERVEHIQQFDFARACEELRAELKRQGKA